MFIHLSISLLIYCFSDPKNLTVFFNIEKIYFRIIDSIRHFKLNFNVVDKLISSLFYSYSYSFSFSFFLLHTNLITGASQIVTVKFRPDRSRVHPYIEEIQILKSSKSIILDDILRIGMIGKVQENQIFVHYLIPTESVFSNITKFNNYNNFKNDINNVKNKSMINMNKKNDNSLNINNEIINSINNPFSSIQNNGMKKLFEDSLKYSNTILPGNPSITLEFPNPHDKNTDPTSYTEIDTKTRKMTTSIPKNISSSSLKSSDSSKSGGQTLGSVIGGEGRVQFKRILIESLIALDKRTGSTAAGSFEVILSTAARDSGIWSVGSAVFNGKNNKSYLILLNFE